MQSRVVIIDRDPCHASDVALGLSHFSTRTGVFDTSQSGVPVYQMETWNNLWAMSRSYVCFVILPWTTDFGQLRVWSLRKGALIDTWDLEHGFKPLSVSVLVDRLAVIMGHGLGKSGSRLQVYAIDLETREIKLHSNLKPDADGLQRRDEKGGKNINFGDDAASKVSEQEVAFQDANEEADDEHDKSNPEDTTDKDAEKEALGDTEEGDDIGENANVPLQVFYDKLAHKHHSETTVYYLGRNRAWHCLSAEALKAEEK